MDEAYEKGEQERLDASEIAAMATEIAKGAIESYRRNSELEVCEPYFKTGESRKIYIDEMVDFAGFQFIRTVQTFEFNNDGTLVSFSSPYTGSPHTGIHYVYLEEEGYLNIQITHRIAADRPGRSFTFSISPEGSEIEETVTLNSMTEYTVYYEPRKNPETGEIEFIGRGVFLDNSDKRKIPEEDFQQLFPAGRSFKLDDLLSVALDPFNNCLDDRLPEINRTLGFPLLQKVSSNRHRDEYITVKIGSDEILGWAYPLETDSNGWLAFVVFQSNNGEENARAVIVSINKEELDVTQEDEYPTVRCSVTIAGEVVNIVLPIKSERNVEDVKNKIPEGFFDRSILLAAMEQFHLTHYVPKPEEI